MADRSSASEYQPSPPINRLRDPGGRLANKIAIRKGTTSGTGVKPNMCCAPATNGERALGLVDPSSPASTTKMMGMSPTAG
jgi:hypothetical protein